MPEILAGLNSKISFFNPPVSAGSRYVREHWLSEDISFKLPPPHPSFPPWAFGLIPLFP